MTLHRKAVFLSLLLAALWHAPSVAGQPGRQDSLRVVARLKSVLPEGARLDPTRKPKEFRYAWLVRFPQPLDHFGKNSGTFLQRVYVSLRDTLAPTVVVTEGYGARRNYTSEPARLLRANQVIVEHRYFGESRPDSLDWRYLNVRQAAADHHAVVAALRRLLRGPWVSTGRSKGGQTALLFKRFYPGDVAATVAYVAPMNLALEDPRIDRFIHSRGDSTCRAHMAAFQRAVLRREDEILPLFKAYAEKRNHHYHIGLNVALEYAVLEYPFSFWQWHRTPCDSIPDSTASAETLFRHLNRVVPMHTIYSDRAMERLYPAFYQFCTELGYYGFLYNPRSVFRRLRTVKEPANTFFGPPGVPLQFHPEVMNDVLHWLRHHGNRIIAIYGGLDPWGATGLVPSGATDAVVVVGPEGDHRTRIATLSPANRRRVLHALQRWLGIAVGEE